MYTEEECFQMILKYAQFLNQRDGQYLPTIAPLNDWFNENRKSLKESIQLMALKQTIETLKPELVKETLNYLRYQNADSDKDMVENLFDKLIK